MHCSTPHTQPRHTPPPPDAWSSTPKEPTVAVYESVLTLVRLLQRHGVGEHEIQAATGIAMEDTQQLDARVPLSQLERLWAFAADRLGNPGIALELHTHYPENRLHFVAHLGMRCPTMRSAIEHWRKYAALVGEPDEVGYVVEGAHARFVYRCNDPRYESRWFAEHFLALACWFGGCFTGLPLQVRQVRMMHPDPGCPEAYDKAFHAPVQFGAAENSVSFDPAYLDLPFRTADSYLHQILLSKADELKASHEQQASVVNRVMHAVSVLLAEGDEITVHGVAGLLRQPTRKLQMALEAEGRRFRDLVDEVRKHSAARYLRRGLSVSQVAALLGFSEPSAFQHAFKRWYEVSPGQFRNMQ